MAAEELARAGAQVTLCDGKPSFGRKFLMAGKSGLNLTKDEPSDAFGAAYAEADSWLAPMLATFGPGDVRTFAEGLGQDVFTGSTGRVFPKVMKTSPLLRAWLGRLDAMGVLMRTRWLWQGWTKDGHHFDTPDGPQDVATDVTVFALGGASWARLGSDGSWAPAFEAAGVTLAPFGAANASVAIDWSAHMASHFGAPLKAVAFTAGDLTSRGEAIISARGLEGGGIYSVSRAVREGADLRIDLKPDWTLHRMREAIAKPKGKGSLSTHLRKALKLGKLEQALLNEWARPLPRDPAALAQVIKALPVLHAGLQPMDEAISTSGGVARAALDEGLMLTAKPGSYCAGEMLDWEAPTGGYLITGCLATGRWAGRSAARALGLAP